MWYFIVYTRSGPDTVYALLLDASRLAIEHATTAEGTGMAADFYVSNASGKSQHAIFNKCDPTMSAAQLYYARAIDAERKCEELRGLSERSSDPLG